MAPRRTGHKGAFCWGLCGFFITVKLQCEILCIPSASEGHLLPLPGAQQGGWAALCPWWQLPSWWLCQPRAQQRIGMGWRSEVPRFGGSAVNVCDRICPLSCAGAAPAPGPSGLQPRLFSHFMREKQQNNKRKILTLFTGFFPPLFLFVWDYAEYNLSPSALF